MIGKPKTGKTKRQSSRATQRTHRSQDSAHPDPISASEAQTRLKTAPTVEAVPDVPADASSLDMDEPRGVIRFGNRTFNAAPRHLAGRKLDILPDLPDLRDRIYQPPLRALRPSIYPTIGFPVRDQGETSSCTGYALAHAIDCLLHREVLADSPLRVSARMLYEMAKRNDEWAGTAYEGSSIRGAINGLFRNGVCSEKLAPEEVTGDWVLTYEMNKAARETRLGAYYRLQPDISDYHAALNEVGVIYASAQIHRNWQAPVNGQIEPGGLAAGGHAFAIVGYDAEGFWLLNSWGDTWGKDGIAHWRYEDWAATIMDAWVLQIGVRAPTAFSAVPRSTLSGVATPQVSNAPNRSDIVGHFINIEDGRYITAGRYASPTTDEMTETVKRLTSASANGGAGYDHLVLYAHGGLNSADDEANRIAIWQRHNIFGRNGIYNFHVMWNSGFLDEIIHPIATNSAGRATGWLGDIAFETGPLKAIGAQAWRNMKQDAVAAFNGAGDQDGGFVGLRPLLTGIDGAKRRPTVHLVGHSAGANVIARLLGALDRFELGNIELGSIHLMAPACTDDLFEMVYGKYLSGNGALKIKDKIHLYCLNSDQEESDKVGIGGLGYGHSLLVLVSRAYEDAPNMPIAGMQSFVGGLPTSGKLTIDYSPSGITASTSHGGFDNDAKTMTAIITRILGHAPPAPPLPSELTGY